MEVPNQNSIEVVLIKIKKATKCCHNFVVVTVL